MKPAAIATHDRKTDPPSSTIGLAENVENPAFPTRTAAALAEELKRELKVANEHWKTVNALFVELAQVEEDERRLLSAEVNRADREKMKEYVVSIVKKLGKLHKLLEMTQRILSGGIELDTRQG